jgi:hypothetical protein
VYTVPWQTRPNGGPGFKNAPGRAGSAPSAADGGLHHWERIRRDEDLMHVHSIVQHLYAMSQIEGLAVVHERAKAVDVYRQTHMRQSGPSIRDKVAV